MSKEFTNDRAICPYYGGDVFCPLFSIVTGKQTHCIGDDCAFWTFHTYKKDADSPPTGWCGLIHPGHEQER